MHYQNAKNLDLQLKFVVTWQDVQIYSNGVKLRISLTHFIQLNLLHKTFLCDKLTLNKKS